MYDPDDYRDDRYIRGLEALTDEERAEYERILAEHGGQHAIMILESFITPQRLRSL